MALGRISVLEFKDPSAFRVLEQQRVLAKEYGVYNCVPAQGQSKWPESTCKILRFWIANAKDTWFGLLDGNSGLLFFRDDQGRIINVKTLLVQLNLGATESFMKAREEGRKLKILLEKWAEFHELTIDYSYFLKISSAAVPDDPMDVEREPAALGKDSVEPIQNKRKAGAPNEYAIQIKRLRISVEGENNPALDVDVWVQDGLYIFEKEKLSIVKSFQELDIEEVIKSHFAQDSGVLNLLAWSRTLAGASVFIVELPTKIKQVVWEPIVFESIYKDIKKGVQRFGLGAVIITDNRKSAVALKTYFDFKLNNLFTTQVTTETLLDSYGLAEDEIAKRLKCQILITTLPMLAAIIKKFSMQINMATFLVINNIHNMPQMDDLQEILQYFSPLKEKKVIVTAKLWKPSFNEFLGRMERPTLCIASPLEVCLRQNCEFILKFSEDQEVQLQQLTEILKQTPPSSRIGVLCSEELLGTIKLVLQNNNIRYSARDGTNDSSRLYLLTDKQITSGSVETVDILIHCSFPTAMGAFAKRFELFRDHLVKNTSNCTVNHLLLNIQNYKTFLKPLEFLLQRDALNEKMVQVCQKLKAKHDSLPENATREICEAISIYGQCSEPFSCPFRHSLNETDVPERPISLDKRVDLKIHSILDPNHYLAEIIRHGKEAQEMERELSRIKYGLGPHFMQAENQIPKTSFAVGELCVFVDKGLHRRGRIVKLSNTGHSKTITIQCLDTGNSFMLSQSEDIYNLPDQFKSCTQVLDMYLLGIAPIEAASGWCLKSIKWLKDNFAIRNYDYFTIQAQIAVSTKNRVFLSSLKIVEIVNKSRIYSFNVKDRLVDEKFAKKDTAGLGLMIAMGDKLGLHAKAKDNHTLLDIYKAKYVAPIPLQIKSAPQDPMPPSEEQSIVVSAPDINTEELMEGIDEIKIAPIADSSAIVHVAAAQQADYFDDGEDWEDSNYESFEYKTPLAEDDEDYDSEFDLEDNLDVEDVALLFRKMLNPDSPEETVNLNPTSTTLEEIVEEDMPETSKGQAERPKLPTLRNGLKYPEVKWSQTEDEIKLRLSSVQLSIKDQYVKLEDSYIYFILKFENDEMRGGLINFFGGVDPNTVTVKLNGLVLTITMAKYIRGKKFMWPRLMQSERPVHWLKQFYKFTELENDNFLEGYEIYQVHEDKNSDEETVEFDGNDFL